MEEHGHTTVQGNAGRTEPATLEQIQSAVQNGLEAIQAGEEPPPEDAQTIAATFIQQMHHSGPLPHPDLFAQYDSVVPGAGNRILTMAERSLELQADSIHNETIEKKAESFALRIVAGSYSLALPMSFILAIVGAFLNIDSMIFSGIGLAVLQTAPAAFEKIRNTPQR